MGVNSHLPLGEPRFHVSRCSSVARPNIQFAMMMMMMILVGALFGRSVIAQDDAAVGDTPATTRSWTLWQRLWVTGDASLVTPESQQWQVRGTVHLTAASTDAAAVIELRDPAPVPEPLIRDIQQLDGRSTGKTWYQLQLVEGTATSTKEATVLTSVPACQIVRAKFRDELVVHVHPMSAHALSLTYLPLLSPWAPNSCADVEVNRTVPIAWETKVTWDTAVPGMKVGQPPLVDPITKMAVAGGGTVKAPPGILWSPGAIPKKPPGDPAAAGQSDEKPDPFAFFKRYWYILVPMLLMNLMTAGSPAPAADAPPASGGAAAAGAAATTAGAATTAAGGARQRRGKKD